jgi:hypothetical protein
MVTTRRSNPAQNETHEEERRPNLGRDDVRGEAESAGSEARIAQLSQQLAQAQKNVEDLLTAAQTPPPLNHDEVEGTNPNGSPEGLGERAEPWIEDHAKPVNLAQSMMHCPELWIGNAMGKNLLWITSSSTRSLYSLKKYPTSTCPKNLRYPKSLFFQEVETRWSIWIISALIYPCIRHPTMWHDGLFLSPCPERPETGSYTFLRGQLIISIPLVRSSWPSLCLEGSGGNPEGIYSPCDRGQTNL